MIRLNTNKQNKRRKFPEFERICESLSFGFKLEKPDSLPSFYSDLFSLLSDAIYCYRKKVRLLQGKGKGRVKVVSSHRQKPSGGGGTKPLFADANKYLRRSEKSEKSKKLPSSDFLDRIAIENSLLLSGTGGGQLYHEQYDEHGVKIEHQCFT